MKTFKELTEAKVTVDPSPWSNSNSGKTPRGQGNWAFSYDRRGRGDKIFFAPGNITYDKARAWAIEKAKKDNKTVIYTMA